MTTTLKQQLEQWIEREAEKQKIYQPKYGGKDHSGYETLMKYEVNDERVECYESGANSILPMLLVALDALEVYSSNKSFTIDGHKNVVVFSELETYWPEHFSKEALNKIKSMMERNGNE